MMLAEQGARGVRVDRVAARLGLTKGSFHHHFDGVDDYHRSLWARYESTSSDAIDRAVTAVTDLPPERALMELPARFQFDPRIEAAFRSWAFESDGARAVATRVDAARLEALTVLWRQVLPGSRRADIAALVPHLLMIGASVALPRPTEADMEELLSLLATLVPAVR